MSKTGQSQDASEEQNVATDFFGLSGNTFGNEKQKPLETVRSGSDAEDINAEQQVNEVPVEITAEPIVKPAEEPKKTEPKETKVEKPVGDVLQVVQSLIDEDILSFDENKEYVEDPTILKELILETKQKAFESGKQAFKEEYPEAAQLLTVLEKGGTIQDYLEMSETVNYAEIPLDHVENQRNLIEDLLITQGYDEDEIADTIADYEKAGSLKKQAEIAQRKMIAWQEKENTNKIQTIAAKAAEQQLAAEKDREEFEKRILGLRNIKGFEISEKKAAELRDYLMKPVKKGETKFKQDDTEENRLLYAYLSMTKFDKEALAREEGTKVTLKLKKNINNFQDPNMNPKRGASDVVRPGQSNVGTSIPWAWGAQ